MNSSRLLCAVALNEARSIHMHLKSLRIHFEDMEETEYADIPKRFPPFFHTLCLIWTHCEHYQQPARLIVLLQEVSNLIIEMVCSTCYHLLIYLKYLYIMYS